MKQPMQPVVIAPDGVVRFQSNKIVEWLFNTGALDLNLIATKAFDDDDRMQLAQLLGYSVSGFGDLSYASEDTIQRADAWAEKLLAAAGQQTAPEKS